MLERVDTDGRRSTLHFMRSLTSAALVGALGLAVNPARGDLFWNFDVNPALNGGHGDGLDPQGWTDTLGASRDSVLGSMARGGRTADAFTGPNPDDGPHVVMVASSPIFIIQTGGGAATVDLGGGTGWGGSAASQFPASLADLGPDGTMTSGTGSSTNLLVLGLRRVSDDVYVSILQRSGNGNDWLTHNWDLSAFADGVTEYHIDHIDSFQGNWGHLELDNVFVGGAELVPEPAGAAVMLSLLTAGTLRRRRA